MCNVLVYLRTHGVDRDGLLELLVLCQSSGIVWGGSRYRIQDTGYSIEDIGESKALGGVGIQTEGLVYNWRSFIYKSFQKPQHGFKYLNLIHFSHNQNYSLNDLILIHY